MTAFPITVLADSQGRITDRPELYAAGRSGRDIIPINPELLIPLPAESTLYLLPGRRALGFNPKANIEPADHDHFAVAAFLPPGYVALALSAFEAAKTAPRLPLFCYCAVCWYRGRFQVPALRVDHDPKHDPSRFDMKQVRREIRRRLRQYPGNRLVAHHGLVCVNEYGCPNAANLFLQRWEAPVAVSGGCNAACQGCISKQDEKTIRAPQARIGFIPTVDEIVEIAVPHLKKAPRAIISFGQGCEGEPLLQGDLIESAIREIRRRTPRGAIHLNTNGSLPDMVERLAAAGLDSIRISLNSSRPALYAAYYRCRSYSFDDVLESFRIARKAGVWISVNYLTFPGVTDDPAEVNAFSKLLQAISPRMIQWRNLNIDPDWYLDTVERACPSKRVTPLGLAALMRQIRGKFPEIRFGYFNPPLG
ncbi:MAG: radical SAM protein [Verrucomicrobia bacterium]|nr:radical SAM protein [Verrucomicrobiota bacterium]MCG2681755.1 radical SAM protein [Kiritimatiellia bacterium]MBU4247169.1 radical SAM protein [Verrucomicrobiota bacterium]MBU4291073.1 radical SAM protein [Verrucomicrobiota bacterium]MBU4429708.1 radical SAM protein [Verrucomicrobiota bacterium]